MKANATAIELLAVANETLQHDISPARMSAIAALLQSMAEMLDEQAKKGAER